jgi:hypothetical protein
MINWESIRENTVDLETAVMLKKLGFDLPVHTAYYVGDIAYWKIARNHNESNVKVSAPTYRQMDEFLNEQQNKKAR